MPTYLYCYISFAISFWYLQDTATKDSLWAPCWAWHGRCIHQQQRRTYCTPPPPTCRQQGNRILAPLLRVWMSWKMSCCHSLCSERKLWHQPDFLIAVSCVLMLSCRWIWLNVLINLSLKWLSKVPSWWSRNTDINVASEKFNSVQTHCSKFELIQELLKLFQKTWFIFIFSTYQQFSNLNTSILILQAASNLVKSVIWVLR